MRHNYSTASRPSNVHEMVVPQKQLLHNLEHTFKVERPLFLNSNRSWADTFLTRASQLTTRSIGRLRLDFDMNEAGIQGSLLSLAFLGSQLFLLCAFTALI